MKTIALTELDLHCLDQAWNVPHRNTSVSGKPLQIAGQRFPQGVGTHARSELLVWLDHGTARFLADVGVDDGSDGKASVQFVVRGDGKILFDSGVMTNGDPAKHIDLDVSAVRLLTLTVENGGDNNSHDHANWADARFEGVRKLPTALPRRTEDKSVFLPGKLWFDTDNQPIQAHGGGILAHGGKYYWYGEDRSNGYIGIGVGAYVSTDLVRWKRLGLALKQADYNQKHGDQTICERPKVIYNPQTKTFVLWFHYDRSGYGDSQAGVAVADKPEGPFRFLGAHRPITGATFRDMNLFVAPDGHAYVFYASEENFTMHVVRLDAAWTAPEQPMVEGKTWARILVGKHREAPAPFFHAGRYYVITSGCTGWSANRADLAVAESPLGPYHSLGDPCLGPGGDKTFESQSTFVLPHPKKPGEFLFLADRWKPEALADARYIWLPMRFEDDRFPLRWHDRWTL